jgi:hypothetical protein
MEENKLSNQDETLLFEKGDKGPILYVRHGKTNYNEFCKSAPKEVARVATEYLDCPLSEEGILQAEDISKTLHNLKINKVFCSPLHRCLETCLISLKNHPEKDNIKVYVHPHISETVSGVHDFSRKIRLKKSKFNLNSEVKFDWSIFDNYFPDEVTQEFYFLNYIDYSPVDGNLENNEFYENVSNLIDKILSPECAVNYSLGDKLLGEMSTHYVKEKRRPEPLIRMFKRNLEFKQLLRDHLEEVRKNTNQINDEKILVFTHSAFTKISTSKIAYNMEVIPDFPVDCYKPDNCEIITMNI